MFGELIEGVRSALTEARAETLADKWTKKSRRHERGRGKDSRGRTLWIKRAKQGASRRERRRMGQLSWSATRTRETPTDRTRRSIGYASPVGINKPVHDTYLKKSAERSDAQSKADSARSAKQAQDAEQYKHDWWKDRAHRTQHLDPRKIKRRW